ncbi:MAG TPA: sulfite exporter TauE/SafE family protein [Segetibacter sp.]|jgi:sulfite exporter TauE/SafE
MTTEIYYLTITAISISFIHTLTGPDHYLPFIALSKANNWTVSKTVLWTVICGIGHVGSSVVLGLGGIALGWSLAKITWLEGIRGGIAGWVMLIIGCVYMLYALVQLRRNKLHKHFDVYDDKIYVYEHKDGEVVLPQQRRRVTPWIMFIVFVLGPCEPLIPLLSFPAAKQSVFGITILVAVFGFFTLLTMVTLVLLGYYGVGTFKTEKLEKYVHVLAAATVVICGAGMVFMGW